MNKETRLKRLIFRSAHRGSKETDLILGPFAKESLASMSDPALDEFEAFLEEGDTDIWNWVCGKSAPSGGRYEALLDRLKARWAGHGD